MPGAEKRLPSPSPNKNLKGHFNAFLQEVLNEEKIFGDEGQPSKILAGATFVQIFLSNQLLKEQDTKACSIADKNKVLTKNGSFAVPSLVASRVLHRSHP